MPKYSAMLTEDPAPKLVSTIKFILNSLDADLSLVFFFSCHVAPQMLQCALNGKDVTSSHDSCLPVDRHSTVFVVPY